MAKAKIIRIFRDTNKIQLDVEGEKHYLFIDKFLNLGHSELALMQGFEFDVEFFIDNYGTKRISTKPKQSGRGHKPAQTQRAEQPIRGKLTYKKIQVGQDDNFAIHLNKTRLFDKDSFDIQKLDGKGGKTTLQTGKYAEKEKQTATAWLPKTETINMATAGRLMVGLGSASVFETSLAFHHVYGVPFIPASSVKGVVRSFAIEQLKGHKKESEAAAFFESKLLCDVFGCPESITYEDENKKKHSIDCFYKRHKNEYKITEKQGEVIFFDAFPTPSVIVEPDIMNPHYGDYYGDEKGKTPPADYLTPNPIIFLSVAKGTAFQFIIGIKKMEHLDLLSQTKTWLEAALKEKGIGAKTAVGYGYMK
ncbi:MAG: type III-B CRISPR module RAMP protein Cmr6 [Saprospiraceae bacterium]|nr:type III-B CRISPR module RAMP protein Cmr6 [Saprospiraceae bacterium]